MCMCMCVYMCVCIRVCVHVRVCVCVRAGRYQKFHIMIIMTVNIPIIDIIVISAELIVTVLRTSIEIVNIGGSISLMLQNLDVIEQNSHGIDDNIILPILRY